MAKEYCGIITYRGKSYEVHWDNYTYLVYISKLENPAIQFLNYDRHKAENKEDATKEALAMLVSVLGSDN